MLCIACAKPGFPLCVACERGLAITHDRVVRTMFVGAPYLHTGTAVRLVHNLKYRRSHAAGHFLAKAMAERVPPGANSLVPVRRSLARRVRFGIDQASFLAEAIGKIADLPVLDVLRPPVWWIQRAGASRSVRRPIAFRASRPIGDGAVLVDDVFTTGSTMASAGRAIADVKFSSLVATTASSIEIGAERVPSLGGDVAVERRTSTVRAPAAQTPSHPEEFELQRFLRALYGSPYREEYG